MLQCVDSTSFGYCVKLRSKEQKCIWRIWIKVKDIIAYLSLGNLWHLSRMPHHCVESLALRGRISSLWVLSDTYSDSKVHWVNMGPTLVLSAPDGPHVGSMNLAPRVVSIGSSICIIKYRTDRYLFQWLASSPTNISAAETRRVISENQQVGLELHN